MSYNIRASKREPKVGPGVFQWSLYFFLFGLVDYIFLSENIIVRVTAIGLMFLGGLGMLYYVCFLIKDSFQGIDDSINDSYRSEYHCPHCKLYLGNQIDDDDRGTTLTCPRCQKELRIPY